MRINRRQLLRACAQLSGASILDVVCNLNLATAASSTISHSDYKGLVCIFLFGGNDSYNMLIPSSTDEYTAYAKARGSLALPLHTSNSDTTTPHAIELQPPANHGRSFSTHSSLRELIPLYNAEELCFVANVGTLVEPTTISQYRRKKVRLPRSLFSHNDQRDQWQTCIPQAQSTSGWIGRATDLLSHHIHNHQSPGLNFSLAGNNLIQTGLHSTYYSTTQNGGSVIADSLAAQIFDTMMSTNSKHLGKSALTSEFSSTSRQSIDRSKFFNDAFLKTKISTTFPNHDLGRNLRAVARMIAARNSLDLTRQTFYILMPGWDTHQDQAATHKNLLLELSTGLVAFNAAMKELNTHNNVTTFSASDFGRTLHSNGQGSDHGWGGNHFVLGGAVNGNQIHGTYPERLTLGGGQDVGENGRLLPTTACDTYFSELLTWFGVPDNLMSTVLPNYTNFAREDSLMLYR